MDEDRDLSPPRDRTRPRSRSRSRSRQRSKSPGLDPLTRSRSNFPAPDLPKPGELQRTLSFARFQKNLEDDVVEEDNVTVDIILVPAIGDDMSMNPKGRDWESVYSGISGARVSVYKHPTIPVQKEHLDFYATELLQWVLNVRSNDGDENNPIHFASHSTGGLVVKKALLIAARLQYYRSIWTACCGLTFFGVPHEGSSIMSDPTFSQSYKELMRLNLAPGVWESLIPLLKPGNDGLLELNRDFAIRARRLRNIWTILESRETFINAERRKIQHRGKALNEIHAFIVDSRSATLRVSNETLLQLNANHKDLVSFEGRGNAQQKKQYQLQLSQLLREEHLRHREDSLESQIQQQLPVDVHLFFEESGIKTGYSAVKVLSVRPNLKEFLQLGPRRSLETRFTDAGQPSFDSQVEVEEPAVVKNVPEILVFDVDVDDHVTANFAEEKEVTANPPDTAVASKQEEKQTQKPQRLNRLWSTSEHKEEHFRWVHIAANHPGWALEAFDSIALDQEVPNPHERIINEHVWHSRHNLAHYGQPHSRRMRSTAKWITQEMSKTQQKASDAVGPSLVLYLPYLHWDTVTGVRRRSNRIRRRKEWKTTMPIPDEIMQGGSMEEKLLWQHSQTPGNLQLHQRRSLDQYGYPSLVTTAARDHDQVLYKGNWLRKKLQEFDKNQELNVVPGMLDQELSSVQTERSRSLKSRTTNLTSELNEKERFWNNNAREVTPLKIPTMMGDETFADGKVLMVDQLWLYITDKDTVVTFFTPKEERNDEETQLIGDLRSSIYNDVNGDPRFATQCHSTVEFAALAVLHAVRLILGHVTDEELQVFQIFEDYISYLKEAQTESFKRFRQTQKDRAWAQTNTDSQAKRSKDEEDEDTRDNIDDLRNLTELRDVDDELSIIRRLLEEQYDVVKSLELQSKPEKLSISSRDSGARNSLLEALEHINNYKRQVDRLKAQCESAHEAYKFLLDMRDKQTNVYEVRQARHSAEVAEDQNRAIIFFTVFTIVFLPLSFFTSFFGMNIPQWSGPDSSLSLHAALTLLFAISVAVIAIALLLAFNKPIRKVASRLVIKPLGRMRKDNRSKLSRGASTFAGGWRRRHYDLETGLSAVVGPNSEWFWSLPQGVGVSRDEAKEAKKIRRPSLWKEKKSNVD